MRKQGDSRRIEIEKNENLLGIVWSQCKDLSESCLDSGAVVLFWIYQDLSVFNHQLFSFPGLFKEIEKWQIALESR